MTQTANAKTCANSSWNAPFLAAAPVIFQSGPTVRGIGVCQRVGKDCITVVTNDRHLPGQRVMVRLAEPVWMGSATEFKTRVEWCHPSNQGRGYAMGLRVIEDTPDAHAPLTVIRLVDLAKTN